MAKRVAILGGGMAALTTALELTDTPGLRSQQGDDLPDGLAGRRQVRQRT